MIRGVDVTPSAEQDLDEIWLTIAADSVDRADKFVDTLTDRLVEVPSHGKTPQRTR